MEIGRSFVAALVIWLALGSAGPVAAQAGDAEPVRVYTNEDLEKYAVYAGSDEDEAVDPAADWSEVEAFLERQYRRLDADRGYDLARARSDRADRRDRDRRQFARRHPVYFAGVHPFFPRFGVPRAHKRPVEKLPHGDGRGIHGPGHGRFSDLKGEDAVPGPRSRRPHNGSDVGPGPGRARKPKPTKARRR